jgi:molecular chaperone GrpE
MNFEDSKVKDDIYEISEIPDEDDTALREAMLPKKPESKEPAKDHKKVEKPEHDEAKSFKNRLKKRDGEIKNLKKENEALLDKYMRAVAEMENLRKRLEREKQEFYQFALSEFLREILTVLDNFERALKNKDQTDGRSFQEGIELISKQFTDLIRKRGVEAIEAVQKKFDPNFHQAVLTEESDQVEEPLVGEEMQKGYTLSGRLLRPSLVKVIVPKKD